MCLARETPAVLDKVKDEESIPKSSIALTVGVTLSQSAAFPHFPRFVHFPPFQRFCSVGSPQRQGTQNYLPPPPESKIELWVAKSMVDTQILENTGKSYLP